MTQTVNNPFFQSYNTPFVTPPFNEINNRLLLKTRSSHWKGVGSYLKK